MLARRFTMWTKTPLLCVAHVISAVLTRALDQPMPTVLLVPSCASQPQQPRTSLASTSAPLATTATSTHWSASSATPSARPRQAAMDPCRPTALNVLHFDMTTPVSPAALSPITSATSTTPVSHATASVTHRLAALAPWPQTAQPVGTLTCRARAFLPVRLACTPTPPRPVWPATASVGQDALVRVHRPACKAAWTSPENWLARTTNISTRQPSPQLVLRPAHHSPSWPQLSALTATSSAALDARDLLIPTASLALSLNTRAAVLRPVLPSPSPTHRPAHAMLATSRVWVGAREALRRRTALAVLLSTRLVSALAHVRPTRLPRVQVASLAPPSV